MKTAMVILALTASGVAMADTIPLPDPAVFVSPLNIFTTTTVALNGVTYSGPSDYRYVSECTTPDGPYFHCNVVRETGILLTDVASGATITVDLTVQSGARLIRSGHNYWRQFAIVLDGEITTP